MIEQYLINSMLGLVIFFGGWFLRDLKKTQDSHSERLRAMELLMSGSYVTRQEFDTKVTAFFTKMDKIEEGVTMCRIQGSCHHCTAEAGRINHREN